MTREEKIAILKALPKNSRVRYIGKDITDLLGNTDLTQDSIGFKLHNGRANGNYKFMHVIIGKLSGEWILSYDHLTCTTIEVTEKLTGSKTTK